MNKYLEIFQRQINNIVSNMDRKQRIRVIVLALLLLAIIITAVVLLNRTEYATLYSQMEPQETAEIYQLLKEQGVDVQTANGETALIVPASQVESLRMQLINQGYPKSGLQYDIGLGDSGMSATSEDKRYRQERQLEQNLTTTISQFEKIDVAIVMVSTKSESAFVISSDETPASATVQLRLRDSTPLTQQEALTIARLVETSIPNIKRQNISISDTMGNNYEIIESSLLTNNTKQYEMRISFEERYEQALRELFEAVLGPGNVRPKVNVELDFDETIEEHVNYFAPEGRDEGLVISAKNLGERIRAGVVEGQVGVDANGGGVPTYETMWDDESDYTKISEEVNYVVDEIRKQIRGAQGDIRKISASIVINLDAVPDIDLSEDIIQLTSTAIGALPENIKVMRQPFYVDTSLEEEMDRQAALQQAAQQADLIRAIILAAAILLSAVLIILMVRSVLKTRKDKDLAELAAAEAAAQAEIAALAMAALPLNEEEEQLMAITAIRDETAARIKDFIDRDPVAAANLLRAWLAEDD